MAYTIIRSNGSTLTTIQDGTINTTSTSLSLPGRSWSGYGQAFDTNFVRITENFAAGSPPANPMKGQLWFNTSTNTLNVCPADGTLTASSWLTLTSTSTSGTATLANVTVTGNLSANNISVGNVISGDILNVRLANVSGTMTATTGTITTGTISTLTTRTITTGGATTTGTLTGSWSVYGNTSGNALAIVNGNLSFASSSVNGIRCDNYMYANGVQFNPSGTYTNANVADYLTGANSIAQFTGNIAPRQITTTRLAGGGTVAGIWTLETGARFQATFADLAERYAADSYYDVGTVVQLGGDKEVTAVQEDLSSDVFGVVSNSYAYLLNQAAGGDDTHPPIALVGRVPVKVQGQVRKGDRLVSAGNGHARAAKLEEVTAYNTIGRSLANKETDGSGTVEAVVSIR
jgi:hypothetical protein